VNKYREGKIKRTLKRELKEREIGIGKAIYRMTPVGIFPFMWVLLRFRWVRRDSAGLYAIFMWEILISIVLVICIIGIRKSLGVVPRTRSGIYVWTLFRWWYWPCLFCFLYYRFLKWDKLSRLETRTKECNTCASRRGVYSQLRNESEWYEVDV
jgi:hypothetical protein